MKAREAILRKRCGIGKEYDFQFSDRPEDPFDEFYTVVKANDCTKNISEPLFSAGLLRDDWRERTEQTAQALSSLTPSGRAKWRDGAIRLNEALAYTPQPNKKKSKAQLIQEADDLLNQTLAEAAMSPPAVKGVERRGPEPGLNSTIRPKIPKIRHSSANKTRAGRATSTISGTPSQIDRYKDLRAQIQQEREKKKRMREEV